MQRETLALIVEQGTRILGAVIRNRDILFPPSQPSPQEVEPSPTKDTIVTQSHTEKATAIATGCIPCSIGHLGTCSGLLNEAMRFARKDGLESGEVIERINMCMDELNALERVDLRPEMIHDLPEWEKSLAEQALTLSRSLRHELEGISDVNTLEAVTAKTQTQRQAIGKSWFQQRLQIMTPEQRQQVEEELRKRAAEKDGE